MTTTDWIIDLLLIALVVRQLHEERFTWRTLLLPVAGVSYAAFSYLHAIPTAGHDVALVALFVATGAILGIAGGLTTHIRPKGDGRVTIQASAFSAALWIASTGGRLAFIIWITHGGSASLARFSAHHSITSADAWTAALILMVLTEVTFRMGLIARRVYLARRTVGGGAAGAGNGRVLVEAGR